MNHHPISGVLRAAIDEGLLPAGAVHPPEDQRPWPVVLLTALGAWLAALPLLFMFGLWLGDLFRHGAGPYVVGLIVLGGAVVVLRSSTVPLFVEQLAVPALLVGGGSLGYGLFRDLQTQAGSAVLAMLAIGVAACIARPWLRVLLGAAAALLLALACLPERRSVAFPSHLSMHWLAWHATLALWLLAAWVQRTLLSDGARARLAAAVESLCAGGLLATLAGLAAWSGTTFLVGGGIGGLAQHALPAWEMIALQAASLMLALAAAWWAARQWPALRGPWSACVALVLIGLAWFMPALGAVLLALAWCVTSGRWRVAAAAALAMAWIVGSFYYQLAWPLATKSVVLVGAAVVLGALAWFAMRAAEATPDLLPSSTPGTAGGFASRAAIGVCAVAVLAVANAGIWRKQDLIAHGQAVFVELAPVDPRSLMQGDFMRLNFRLPNEVQAQARKRLGSERPHVVARRDARGVLTVLRIDEGAPLAADELRFELTPKDGRWILVSDAWFFSEGEARRWEAAKYGEFRVDSTGRALLVGLRGAKLEAL